jgi:cell division protein FtsX
VGTKTLDVLGKSIGDTVHAKGRSRALDFRIVGRVALPTLGQSQPLADGAIFTGRGFAPLFDPNLFERFFVVRFAPDADAAAVTARLVAIPQLVRQSGPTQPVEIARVRQVNWFPFTLAILLGVLGFVALLHALVTSVQRRRREFAVLKTLGFTRRQVRATVAWHATALGVVGLAVGIPVGLVVGAVVWHAVAHGFGTATATATSALAVLVLVPGALVVVNLAALLPGRAAGRADPAVALRSE